MTDSPEPTSSGSADSVSSGLSDRHVTVIKLALQAVMAIVLVVAMTWIVLSQTATDEAAKAALVVVSGATGYLFGRNTA